jgi:hypothetical protein
MSEPGGHLAHVSQSYVAAGLHQISVTQTSAEPGGPMRNVTRCRHAAGLLH